MTYRIVILCTILVFSFAKSHDAIVRVDVSAYRKCNLFCFQMRFLDCTGGEKKPSRSLLDVGVKHAINQSGFDEKMFFKRGGKYTWSKEDLKLDW